MISVHRWMLPLAAALFSAPLFAFGSAEAVQLSESCKAALSRFSGSYSQTTIDLACQKVSRLPECESVQKVPIFHYDKYSKSKGAKNVLVFSLIHGDEEPAGAAGRFWMERLENIEPRNNWRIVPLLNPDGYKLKTRTNANKVDLNRNFPTKDWDEKAKVFWEKSTSSNPRRFPGNSAASEPELKCALKHIEEFKPDFVVSIHTPLKILDFDGPRVKPPKFDYLPWKSLGHYPGSLGRYLWFERQTPVLTMELKEELPKTSKPLIELQDVIGFLVNIEFGISPKISNTQ